MLRAKNYWWRRKILKILKNMNIIPMIPLFPRHGLRGLREEKERLRTGHRVPCEMAREDLRLAQAWPSNALSAVATKLRKENIRKLEHVNKTFKRPQPTPSTSSEPAKRRKQSSGLDVDFNEVILFHNMCYM